MIFSGPDPREVQNARGLCEDLLTAVKQQYEDHKTQPQPARFPGYGGNNAHVYVPSMPNGHSPAQNQGHNPGQNHNQGQGQGQGQSNGQGHGQATASPPTQISGLPTSVLGASTTLAVANPYAAYYGTADPYAAYGGYQAYVQYCG